MPKCTIIELQINNEIVVKTRKNIASSICLLAVVIEEDRRLEKGLTKPFTIYRSNN